MIDQRIGHMATVQADRYQRQRVLPLAVDRQSYGFWFFIAMLAVVGVGFAGWVS